MLNVCVCVHACAHAYLHVLGGLCVHACARYCLHMRVCVCVCVGGLCACVLECVYLLDSLKGGGGGGGHVCVSLYVFIGKCALSVGCRLSP